jgi:hypothetical protein
LRMKPVHLDSSMVKHPDRISVISKSNGWLTVDS